LKSMAIEIAARMGGNSSHCGVQWRARIRR
jgi:hypothetical protein